MDQSLQSEGQDQVSTAPESITSLDPGKRYVRVTGERHGFIEFDFAIGNPEIFTELLLRPHDFEEFCFLNKTEVLEPATEVAGDWAWRLSDATRIRLNRNM